MGIVAEGYNSRLYGFDVTDKNIRRIRWRLRKALKSNKRALHSWMDIQNRARENKKKISKNKYYKWILKYNFKNK